MKPIEDFVLDFTVNALWQPVLLAVIAALCLRLLLRRASARHHHVVWSAALILESLASTPNTDYGWRNAL